MKTLFLEPGSPWENGYIESFNGKLRDELVNLEIFTTSIVTCTDEDEDGYGSPGDASCINGDAEDCNDADPEINPVFRSLPG